MKVGIIGTGRHGARYARHIIHDVEGMKLTAISRRGGHGLEQARQWKASFFDDWRGLVADRDVEAVIAVVTPNLNLAIAEECAGRNKPLLIEKPLALHADEAERIVALFQARNLPLTVGQTLRYNSTVLALRREIDSIGSLYFFSANQRLEKTLHEWLDEPDIAGGGVILHTAVHLFDALRYITGLEIKKVFAHGARRHTKKLEDQFGALVEMDSGIQGIVDASKIGTARTGRFEFVGENGQLHGDQVHGFIQLVRDSMITDLPHEEPVNTIIPLLSRWRDFLLSRGPNPIPGEEGLAAVRICDACGRSAREGKWVEVMP